MTEVSELLAAKILAAAQACELLQLRAQAEFQRLMTARDALIEQARTEVQAPAGHQYHAETRTFQPPNGPRPLSTRPTRQAKRAQKGAA